MKLTKVSRRRFVVASLLYAPLTPVAAAKWFGVDQYYLGLFHTAPGPLYVNPGIGWYPVPIRFNCRPEITVFEL